jgi:hypothetical protein
VADTAKVLEAVNADRGKACNRTSTSSELRDMMLQRALPLILGLAALAPAARAADPAHPIVVELYQSQSCSSCPPANANLLAIAGRPDVLALSFGVTYWDDLGWKDTFAKPQFTARQWDYAHGLGHSQVFTPQVVVNGRSDGVGASRAEFDRLVAAGGRAPPGPGLSLAGGQVSIGAAPTSQAADVWLVRYDPRTVQVPIRRGENGGKTLPHRNVVKQLVRLGGWSGKPETLRLPAGGDPALKTAVFLQLTRGGPILAAAKG